jgi:hypothetical protein
MDWNGLEYSPLVIRDGPHRIVTTSVLPTGAFTVGSPSEFSLPAMPKKINPCDPMPAPISPLPSAPIAVPSKSGQ